MQFDCTLFSPTPDLWPRSLVILSSTSVVLPLHMQLQQSTCNLSVLPSFLHLFPPFHKMFCLLFLVGCVLPYQRTNPLNFPLNPFRASSGNTRTSSTFVWALCGNFVDFIIFLLNRGTHVVYENSDETHRIACPPIAIRRTLSTECAKSCWLNLGQTFQSFLRPVECAQVNCASTSKLPTEYCKRASGLFTNHKRWAPHSEKVHQWAEKGRKRQAENSDCWSVCRPSNW